MPKNTKAAEAYFGRRHQSLQDANDKHLQAVQENLRTARAKKADLLKAQSLLIKHAQVRKLFLRLTKTADLEKTVTAIDEGTKTNKGQQWEGQYIENLTELCRLTDDALITLKKVVSKKEEEEKKIMEIQRKAEEFHNSCLAKLQELKTEGQKPFQISSTDGPGGDYLYSKTPFQCYQ